MKKIFFLPIFIQLNTFSILSWIEDTLELKFAFEKKEQSNRKKIFYMYGNEKLQKTISCYLYKEKIFTKNKTILKISILLIQGTNNIDHKIINTDKKIEKTNQWHVTIETDSKIMTPYQVTQKETDIKDIEIFGKNHTPYGIIFDAYFEIDPFESERFTFSLQQRSKKYSICLE